MKQVYCEKEAEIIQALRCGALGTELESHVASCAVCADTLAVSEFLLADRAAVLGQQRHSERSAPFAPQMVLRGEEPCPDLNASTVDKNARLSTPLPDSDFLWWKAQLARKQIAVEHATRSIALVRKVSYLGAAAAALWLVFAPGHTASILRVLSRHEIWRTGALTQSALSLSVGALVFALLGSLYLVCPEK